MNPSLLLIFILLISIELSFTTKILFNILVIFVGFLMIFKHKHKLKTLLFFLFFPIIPAFTSFWSIYVNNNPRFALVMFTRIYAYISLGIIFSGLIKDYILVLNSLEQNLHIPTKFIYGIRSALTLAKNVKEEVKTIKYNALMHDCSLHIWSPKLFFKAIVSSMNWTDKLNEAMKLHAFNETSKRSIYKPIKILKKDWIIFTLLLSISQILIFIINY